jgi:predicted dienelactone hydrolase
MSIYRGTLVLLATVAIAVVRIAMANEQPLHSDPGEVGPYAVGVAAYSFVDTNNGNRPEYVLVWYPVDASTITSSSPPAQYLLDPYTGTTFLPATLSTDWEPLGYDPAYEGPRPSGNGPFPLVMVSPAFGGDAWQYLFIGTRLASHGYVVAALEPYADCVWPWDPCDALLTVMVNRPRDVSFVITQLLAKSRTPGELLFQTIDPDRIAASGHSIGGYTTDALAGGDDLVCDSLIASGGQTPPPGTCMSTLPDRRIKAMISLDGSSWALRYEELGRILIPSLIMGETLDNSAQLSELAGFDATDWIARAHAAIDRPDSYRVDANGANHYSFTNLCDVGQVFLNLGLFSAADLTTFLSSWPCASTGLDAVTISSADEHKVVTKYMIAFLNVYLRRHGPGTWRDRSILTPEYALDHKPTVQFFYSEECRAALPNPSYFTYRPHQKSDECAVAAKDPPAYFAQ